jgi:hypothetical protein
MEQEAAQLKALVELTPAQRHRRRFLPVHISYCQEIISKYDDLQRSHAVVLVEPASSSDEAAPSPADSDLNALPRAQRLEAILRAPRLPDVINLANVENSEKGDRDEETLEIVYERNVLANGILHDPVVILTADQWAQLLHQMKAHTNLTILNLSANAPDSLELLEAITNQKNLKTLDLSWKRVV